MNTPAPVLQGINPAQPLNFEGFNHAIQINQQNKILRQREQFMAEQRAMNRQQQTAEFVSRQLKDPAAGTGLDDDPKYQEMMNTASAKAYEMVQKGNGIGDVQNMLAPYVAQMNQYRGKAKFIENERQQALQKLKQFKGYDIEGIDAESRREQLYDVDPKTGEHTTRDVRNIDPTVDYVQKAIEKHPELANYNGLDNYIKNMQRSDREVSVTTPTNKLGGTQSTKYNLSEPGWMDFDRDDKGNIITDKAGNPTGVVPRFTKIKDDVSDPDGKVLGRAVTQDVYNQITRDNPDALQALRGETMKDMRAAAVKAGKDPDSIDFRDPASQLHARALLYTELANRTKTSYKTAETPKQGAAEVHLNMISDPRYQQAQEEIAKLKKEGTEAATPQKPGKSSLPDVVGGLYSGELKGEPTPYEGKSYEDVTSLMPKGMLKYGPGAGQLYHKVMFDRSNGDMLTFKPGATSGAPDAVNHYTEKQMGQFITQHAAANGLPSTQVAASLKKIGFQNGQFANKKLGGDDDANQKLAEENALQINQALTGEKYDALKGATTKDGTITKVVSHNILGNIGMKPRFEVTVTKDGKQQTLPFKSKEEMQSYLTSGAEKQKAKSVVQNGVTYELQPDGSYK